MTSSAAVGQQHRPAVSVCIPVYNGERFIAETIQSVLDQTFGDFELLISDNASTDGTVPIIEAFDDPRIRLLRNETNIGPGRNYNRLLAEARGRYIKVLSADDFLMPESLERMVAVFEDPANEGVVLVTARREVVDDNSEYLTSRGPRFSRKRMPGTRAIRQMARSGTNLVGETSATLFRAEMVDRIGMFLDDAPYCVDMDYWFRMLAEGDLYMIPEALSAYRVSQGAWSLDVLDKQEADVVALLERERDNGIAGVTERDVRRGQRVARLTVRLRRLFYTVALVPATHRQKIAYLFAGGWNTLFGYLCFAFLWTMLGPTFTATAQAYIDAASAAGTLPSWVPSATTLATWAVLIINFFPGTANAYVTYKYFVFRTKGGVLRELPRFSVVYVVTLLANMFALPALIHAFDLNPYVAQAIFTVAVVITSYLGHRYFSFSRPR